MHNVSTLIISHTIHCFDIEVDVGPQIWNVQAYVMVIITSSSSIFGVPDTLSADAEAHKVTEYI